MNSSFSLESLTHLCLAPRFQLLHRKDARGSCINEMISVNVQNMTSTSRRRRRCRSLLYNL